MAPNMTPAEYGRRLASLRPPLTDEQVEAAARILASVEVGEDAPHQLMLAAHDDDA